MKFVIIFLTLVVAAFSDDKYEPTSDHFDIDSLVSSKEKVQAVLDCFLDKGQCDEFGSDFKKDIPEAVKQACAKCTPAQINIFKRFIDALEQKIPAGIVEFKKKYDPENKYFGPLQAALKKQ